MLGALCGWFNDSIALKDVEMVVAGFDSVK